MPDASTAVLGMVGEHLKDETDLMYIGPDNGAHYPYYFTRPANLPRTFAQLKRVSSVLRCTASLFDEPHRTMPSAKRVWCVGQDFDFDRNGWADVPRDLQEATLAQVCEILPPTFCTKTRNGYHLFWLLKKPESIFGYSYPSSLLQQKLRADAHSVVPVHCLSFHSSMRKPASISDRIELPATGKEILTYPHSYRDYTLDEIRDTLTGPVSPRLTKLALMLNGMTKPKEGGGNGGNGYADIKESTDYILERCNLTDLLRKAGYRAYARGSDKIILCCPYHPDRHPSAFINLNPASTYYGWFTCVSCDKHVSVQRLLQDLMIQV